jgi:D-beta-D-heptose 7-phosphate kinase / D-beta-D-heptose 1-phosphate adenosyltransferase
VSASLPRIVDAFAGASVLVIGEAMLDSYLEGSTTRLCPEAPVPVVALSARHDRPGGAANAAANAATLGARVSLLSVVGDDPEGAILRDSLQGRGVGTAHLMTQPGRRTLAKHRVVAGSHLLVRFDQGCTGPIAADVEARLIWALESLWAGSDAVVVSDYGYGVLTPGVIAKVAAMQAVAPRVLVVDSKRLADYREARPAAVKPNYGEALALLGAPDPGTSSARVEWMAAQGPRILEMTGARIAAVTLDAEGALVFERDRPPYRTYARPERHAKAAGAGDTFVAALALALAAGAEAPAAADLASAASAAVVGKEGTASCDADELRERVSPAGKPIAGPDELARRLESYRRQGRRVVFTNGCFDILHRGHVSYLSRAKALGDVLIVGVNSDASIRRLKGPERPINGLDDRVEVLSALSCVDHVIPFDEDTPHDLIRAVRPDVFVKGGDYTRAMLPEAELVERLGGVVEILPFVSDRSTTDIIARIRRAEVGMAGDGLETSSTGGRPVGIGSGDGHLLGHRNGA